MLVVEIKEEGVKERERELSTLLWCNVSPYINEPLSNTQESVQASGICLSMKRINTISTENKEKEEREKKTEKEETGRQNGIQREHEIQSKGVINATSHSLIRLPPTH